MTTLHVACAAEGAYDRHSATMLHSVLAHAAPLDVHVHYLHGPRFPSGSLERIASMVSAGGGAMTAHEIADERVAGVPVVDQFTLAMWYRVLLPELVDADRVLYLDIDTLAMSSLEPLWATDLGDAYLAAVTNVLMPQHRHRPASLGLPSEAYFNSGVLLLNLDALRRDACTDALLGFARSRGDELEWPDQDTLNVVLGARRVPLHPRWNAMNVLGFPWATEVFPEHEIADARAHPGIRHFEGPDDNKPWHPRTAQPDREAWFRHRRGTPWPREPARVAAERWATGVRRRLRR